MNSFSAYALSWNQPEPSICSADQKERSSGDENELKLTLKETVRKWNFLYLHQVSVYARAEETIIRYKGL